MGAPASSGQSSKVVRGAAGSGPPTLRWFRPPRLRLPVEALVAGEIDRLGIDVEHAAGGGLRRRPAAPTVIAYPGRQGSGCSRFPYRWREPRINPGRGGGWRISPRAVGGAQRRVVEAVDRSGAAPKSAGSKRAAPEQDSSGRLANKSRVCSKM
jgi:hypothetical protein